MATPDRVIWEWQDVAAGFLRASNSLVTAASLPTLDVPLQACSNAQLIFATAAAPAISPFSPSGGQYDLVTDIAVLVFATAAPSTIQLVIPAPLATCFGPTSNVVNPTDPNVAALIAAVIGNLTDQGGNVVTAYVSGVKSSRRTEQV